MTSGAYNIAVRPFSRGDDPMWDSFVSEHPAGHLLQTSGWARLKARFGWSAWHVTANRGGTPVAGAQVLFRRYAGGLIAYVPKGPVLDWGDTALTAALLAGIRDLGARQRAVFIKLEPNAPNSAELTALLSVHGYRAEARTVQPRSTIILDVSPPEEAILAGMKPKWRYNVRLAERKGVRVRAARPEEIAKFYELSCVTSLRDGFPIHGRVYYEAAHEEFVNGGMGRLLLATVGDEILAGLMVFALGKTAWYMYGASAGSHRNLMPNHLLQWEAIRWARARGCTQYDFWGIPDEVGQSPEIAHAPAGRPRGLWGVYRFKEGFGGQVVRWAGAFDYVLNRPVYFLGNTAWPIVRRTAHILTRRRTNAEAEETE